MSKRLFRLTCRQCSSTSLALNRWATTHRFAMRGIRSFRMEKNTLWWDSVMAWCYGILKRVSPAKRCTAKCTMGRSLLSKCSETLCLLLAVATNRSQFTKWTCRTSTWVNCNYWRSSYWQSQTQFSASTWGQVYLCATWQRTSARLKLNTEINSRHLFYYSGPFGWEKLQVNQRNDHYKDRYAGASAGKQIAVQVALLLPFLPL